MRNAWLKEGEELSALLKRCREGEIELCNIEHLPGGDYIHVAYKPCEEKPEYNPSLAIAAWTTALARVRLNKVLQKYPDRIVYADTG